MAMVYCRGCAKEIHETAISCPQCGAVQAATAARPQSDSTKRILPAAILCFFLGFLGAHRFYVGKVGTGILQLVTLGGFGIWAFIDFIMIVIGSFSDADGNRLTLWT